MPHGTNAALHVRDISNPAQRGRNVVTVLECGCEALALNGIVAQPVQQFGEAPLGRVDAATPVDGGEFLLSGGFGDVRGFLPGTVIAPEIVFVKRL